MAIGLLSNDCAVGAVHLNTTAPISHLAISDVVEFENGYTE